MLRTCQDCLMTCKQCALGILSHQEYFCVVWSEIEFMVYVKLQPRSTRSGVSNSREKEYKMEPLGIMADGVPLRTETVVVTFGQTGMENR